MQAFVRGFVLASLLTASITRGSDTLPLPGITVWGHGEVSVVPDRVLLRMAAMATDLNPGQALSAVNRVASEFVARARALGVGEREIRSAAITLRAQYDESDKPRRFLGYQATHPIEILLQDLSKLGALLEAAKQAGINRIEDPHFESSRASALRREALAAAARDAETNAQTLAQALGLRLGLARVVSTAESPQPVVLGAAPLAASSNEMSGLEVGLIRYEAQVKVQFDLKPPGP
ncbi:SIMPL domain-containing protein [Candidatus Methylacidithermus pantelleriae]|uniref:26 kDa periplasmic immunogenic protein n=1 Tax=Candidatus Methylacidithermus pantelleriae TaxID=2744239 RepID=A0A8J2BLG9_9BACT|nr:SIMPL domain-containing protein [Candidatus Methylacidithermus pantelleriae]CAF0702749.1 conserved hypothetical protein [Candidatus Methylacidithermus pantelleriae]